MKHALFALRETAGQRSEGLTAENTTIAIVGLDHPFVIYEDETVQPYVSLYYSLFFYFLAFFGDAHADLFSLSSSIIWPWRIKFISVCH